MIPHTLPLPPALYPLLQFEIYIADTITGTWQEQIHRTVPSTLQDTELLYAHSVRQETEQLAIYHNAGKLCWLRHVSSNKLPCILYEWF